jgi:hypothetical protein
MRMSISDRASQARLPQREARPKPQFIARAKVDNGWITIGACWPLRSGEEGFSLKLTSTPLNWDGRFVLLPPIVDEETAKMAEE